MNNKFQQSSTDSPTAENQQTESVLVEACQIAGGMRLTSLVKVLVEEYSDPEQLFDHLSQLYAQANFADKNDLLNYDQALLLLANMQLIFTSEDPDFYCAAIAPLQSLDPVLFALVRSLHAQQENNYFVHSELAAIAHDQPALLLETLTAILDRNESGIGPALRVLYSINPEKAHEYATKLSTNDDYTQQVIDDVIAGYETKYEPPPDLLTNANLELARQMLKLAEQALYTKGQDAKLTAINTVATLPQLYALAILGAVLQSSQDAEKLKAAQAIQSILLGLVGTQNEAALGNLASLEFSANSQIFERPRLLPENLAGNVYDMLSQLQYYTPGTDLYVPLLAKTIKPEMGLDDETRPSVLNAIQSFLLGRSELLENMSIAVAEKVLTEGSKYEKYAEFCDTFKRGVKALDENALSALKVSNDPNRNLNLNDPENIKLLIRATLPDLVRQLGKADFVRLALEVLPTKAITLNIDPSNLAHDLLDS